jgi:hypothetical protein
VSLTVDKLRNMLILSSARKYVEQFSNGVTIFCTLLSSHTEAYLTSSSLPQPCAQHSSTTHRALDPPGRPRSISALLSPRQPFRKYLVDSDMAVLTRSSLSFKAKTLPTPYRRPHTLTSDGSLLSTSVTDWVPPTWLSRMVRLHLSCLLKGADNSPRRD